MGKLRCLGPGKIAELEKNGKSLDWANQILSIIVENWLTVHQGTGHLDIHSQVLTDTCIKLDGQSG